MLGARVIAVAVGYCFGLFQTGYIYGEKHGVDIRTQGSGNAGTTNTLRVLGWKAGLITFLGDLFKAIFAVLLIRFIFIGKYPDAVKILELYAGFGAVLGHNFPFYLKFYIVSACFTAMALWRHKANIKRLLTGTENKFGMKKN